MNTKNGNDIWYNKLKLKVYQKRLFIINFPFSRNACVPRINSTNYENVEKAENNDKEEIDLSTMLLNLLCKEPTIQHVSKDESFLENCFSITYY